MNRPKQSLTDEFRLWSRRRFCIKRYLHETLDIENYGNSGYLKKLDQEKEQYTNLKQYADDLLANAILDAMPKEDNPYDYCEEFFGKETKLSMVGVMTPEGKERKSYKEKTMKDRVLEAWEQMTSEEQQKFKDIMGK